MIIKNVVILAGGEGKRMRDLLGSTPKVLASVNGVPFIHLLLDRWKNTGIENIHLLLGYKSNEIWNECIEWHSKSDNSKVKLSASIEPYPLGDGGALLTAKPFLNAPFFFTYGDVYPTVDIQALSDTFSDEFDICMSVCPQDIAMERGNVELFNDTIICYDKAEQSKKYVEVGLMIIRPSILKSLELGFRTVAEILKESISNGKVKAYLHYMPSKHIGDPVAYNEFIEWYNDNITD